MEAPFELGNFLRFKKWFVRLTEILREAKSSIALTSKQPNNVVHLSTELFARLVVHEDLDWLDQRQEELGLKGERPDAVGDLSAVAAG